MGQLGTNKSWTDAEIEQLRILIAAGLSGDQIGMRLGRSRNAIAGLCNRLGLSLAKSARLKPELVVAAGVLANRASAARAKPVVKAKTPPRPVPARATAPALAPVQPTPLSATPIRPDPILFMAAREGQCRFPLAAAPAADMPVCGAPTVPGLSWCAACAGIVFNRPTEALAKLRSMPR